MSDDKPMTQTEFYADYYHKKIEEIYEQVFEYMNYYKDEAIKLLLLIGSGGEKSSNRETIISAAIANAGGVASLEDFKEQVLRPLWKYDSVEMAWEAYRAKHNLVTSDDDNAAPFPRQSEYCPLPHPIRGWEITCDQQDNNND